MVHSPDAYRDRAASVPKKRTPLNQRRSFWAILLIVVVIAALVKKHYTSTTVRSPVKPVFITLATAKSANVPVYLVALGAVTPTYTVTVQTQINGTLMQVFYKEGQMVKAGTLLAQIDPRLYEAQLIQYEGQLARDQALLDNALIDLKRYQTLWKQDSISQQTLATQQALVRQYEGNVVTDKGLIMTAKVNIYYCRITSPITGRVGLRLVDPGNYVQTTDTTGIAVLTTLDPITVIFTIPEDNIPDVRQQIYAGKTFSVEAYDRTQTQLLATGTTLTIDNQIDATTGTVKLRAQFNNSDYRLFSGQFVNVRLLVKTLQQATVVPTAAIQYAPNGSFVYVFNQNETVKMQPVEVGVTTGNLTVITKGVTPSQQVVTEGADNLTDGAKVKVATANVKVAAAKV